MRIDPLRLLLRSQIPYIDTQALENLLADYKNPKVYIAKLVDRGELIRLKGGFFLIQEIVDKEGIPFAQIANLLYGPSYLSLEYALSFYGIIPEAAYVYTSITLGRAKKFHTPVGTFIYHHLKEERYQIGVSHKVNESGGFFMATPEKALADHVFRQCSGLSPAELLTELTESMRIEPSTLRNLDKILLMQIANAYHSKIVSHLANVVIES